MTGHMGDWGEYPEFLFTMGAWKHFLGVAARQQKQLPGSLAGSH